MQANALRPRAISQHSDSLGTSSRPLDSHISPTTSAKTDLTRKRDFSQFFSEPSPILSQVPVSESNWAVSNPTNPGPVESLNRENILNCAKFSRRSSLKSVDSPPSRMPQNIGMVEIKSQNRNELGLSEKNPTTSIIEPPSNHVLERGIARIRNLLSVTRNIEPTPADSISQKTQNLWTHYKNFQKAHSPIFEKILNFNPQDDPLKSTVLRFLTDLLSRKDLDRLNGKQLLFAEKFIFDRYFKFLKNRIFKAFEKKRVLIDFAMNLCENIGLEIAEQDLDICFSQVYKHYTAHLTQMHRKNAILFGFNLNLFQSDFFESCKHFSENPKNFEIFFRKLVSIFMVFLVKAIFRLVSMRYRSPDNFPFEEIENLEHLILRIGASFLVTVSLSMQNFLKHRSSYLSTEDSTLLSEQLEESFALIGQICDWDQRTVLYDICSYIKERELRQSLTRKKKTSFTKPKRNDEKLKKVYKQLMKRMNYRFLEEQAILGSRRSKEDPHSQLKALERKGLTKQDNSNTLPSLSPLIQKSIAFNSHKLQTFAGLPNHSLTVNNMNESQSLCDDLDLQKFDRFLLPPTNSLKRVKTPQSDRKHVVDQKAKRRKLKAPKSKFISDIFCNKESEFYLSESEEEIPLFFQNPKSFFSLPIDQTPVDTAQDSNHSPHPYKPSLTPRTIPSQTKIQISSPYKHLPNSKMALLTSREREKLFYENFFAETARNISVPIEAFYDPLKQKFVNPLYKSFTSKYFQMLLRSASFKSRVSCEILPENLVLDVMKELPSAFEGQGPGTGLGLINQHLPKAKFPWTVFEFFFALEFFRVKFKL